MKLLGTIASGGFGRVDRVQLADGTIAALKVFAPSVGVLAGASPADLDKLRVLSDN